MFINGQIITMMLYVPMTNHHEDNFGLREGVGPGSCGECFL